MHTSGFIWVVETVGFNPGLSIRDGDERPVEEQKNYI
jgi:hypothetical protein